MPSGATHAVNYKTQNFAEEVAKITEGKGVDVILDFVGRTHWEKNINSLAVDGRMTIFAFMSGSSFSILPSCVQVDTRAGSIIPEVNIQPILYKRLRIQGSTLRSRSLEYQGDLIQRLKRDFIPKMTGKDGNGPIKTYIHSVYNWKDIQDAHREMEANKNMYATSTHFQGTLAHMFYQWKDSGGSVMIGLHIYKLQRRSTIQACCS